MSDTDFTEDFDAPILEPVKGIGDVKFVRADCDYWATWASALNTKRFNEDKADIEKTLAHHPTARVEAMAAARRRRVQLFEVMDLQFTPDGIEKILKDAYINGGGTESDWLKVRRRIGPARRQQLASDIASEPRPTTAELRDGLRDMLKKTGKTLPGIETMTDEDLIAASREYQPSAKTEGEGSGPLPGTPLNESEAASTTDSADISSGTIST